MYERHLTQLEYVCPICFHRIEGCTCRVSPQYLIWVDSGIQEHVRILNEKGYCTTNSYESHNQNGNMYVAFAFDYGFDEAALPRDFVYMKKHPAVSFMYKRRTTNEEFAIQKREHLAALLDWCRALPPSPQPNRSLEWAKRRYL